VKNKPLESIWRSLEHHEGKAVCQSGPVATVTPLNSLRFGESFATDFGPFAGQPKFSRSSMTRFNAGRIINYDPVTCQRFVSRFLEFPLRSDSSTLTTVKFPPAG
jgi:hypothetical protein